ncbi:MAG: fasciclin domain-containing protein, partial [Ilumatobacter sp.]
DAAVTTDAPPATEPETDGIVDIVDDDPLFGELAGLLATAGLDGPDALGGDGPFTLLAPTDAAFDAAFDDVGADAFIAMMSDPDTLRTLLLHHATDGAIMASDFVAGDLDMLDGTPVAVDPDADGGITFTSNDVAAGVDDPATQLDIEASNGVVHAIDRLLVPEGFVLGDVAGATPPTIAASLLGGRLTLTGDVQSEEQRLALVAAAQTQVDPANVVDSLAVDPNVALGAADVERLSTLITLMVPNLVEGRADLAGSGLGLTGTYVDEAAEAALAEFATAEGIDLVLSPRPTADADAAAALQVELNEFARDNPILFEANSGTLTLEAGAVIDQLAARAARLDGVAIVIVGHTDSDGDPVANQARSEMRAASVRQALVERDLDPATLTSTGRGSTQPIVDEAGAEDKVASRRVEFVVSAR